jgi:hypothetical protein
MNILYIYINKHIHIGLISCSEFIKGILALGNAEHDKELRENYLKKKHYEDNLKLELKKIEDLQILRNAKEYTKEFGEEDMKNVLKVLSEVARKYDKNMPGQPMMDGFDNILYMEPHIFKDQLQRSFKIKITPREMGALMSYFNADEKGNVYMASFLGKFFKIGIHANV